LEKILESVSEEMNQVILFSLETAMRRGELAGMTWEMVDLKKRTVTLLITKNGEKRIVPLSSVAVTILKERLSARRIDGKVWDIGLDAISKNFARACQKAEISGLHFHDLRHEATSRLFEKGFDTMEVRTITGHKTLQMLARYTHLRAEDLVERLK
jgi:integrase